MSREREDDEQIQVWRELSEVSVVIVQVGGWEEVGRTRANPDGVATALSLGSVSAGGTGQGECPGCPWLSM